MNKKPILWLKFNWLDPIFTPVRKTNTKYEKGSILRVYFNYRTDDYSNNTRFYRIIHLKQFTPSLGTNLFPTILYIPTDTIMVANSPWIVAGPGFDSQGCVNTVSQLELNPLVYHQVKWFSNYSKTLIIFYILNIFAVWFALGAFSQSVYLVFKRPHTQIGNWEKSWHSLSIAVDLWICVPEMHKSKSVITLDPLNIFQDFLLKFWPYHQRRVR